MPCCMATSADAGQTVEPRHVADREHLGVAGQGAVGADSDAPARSQSAPVASASILASGDAWTPAAQTLVRAATRSTSPSWRLTATP